jgi:hypothetical protein
VRLTDILRGIETTLRDSTWSLYDRTGTERLRKAILAGEVR